MIFTSYFINPELEKREDLIKISIARYRPRFKIPYRLLNYKMLAPQPRLLKEPYKSDYQKIEL